MPARTFIATRQTSKIERQTSRKRSKVAISHSNVKYVIALANLELTPPPSVVKFDPETKQAIDKFVKSGTESIWLNPEKFSLSLLELLDEENRLCNSLRQLACSIIPGIEKAFRPAFDEITSRYDFRVVDFHDRIVDSLHSYNYYEYYFMMPHIVSVVRSAQLDYILEAAKEEYRVSEADEAEESLPDAYVLIANYVKIFKENYIAIKSMFETSKHQFDYEYSRAQIAN